MCSLWLIFPQKYSLSHSPRRRRELSGDHLVFIFVSLSLMFSMSCSCTIVGFIVGNLLSFSVVIIVVCIIVFYMQLSKLYNPFQWSCDILLSYPVITEIFATFFQFLFILSDSTWRRYHSLFFSELLPNLVSSVMDVDNCLYLLFCVALSPLTAWQSLPYFHIHLIVFYYPLQWFRVMYKHSSCFL